MRGILAKSGGLRRLSGAGPWQRRFNSPSGIAAVLVLDYAGVAGGQFFANDINTKTFDNLHTFARASTATVVDSAGLITTSATGTKRLDHDKNGQRIGLLIEEAGTNVCLQSEDFSTTWIVVGTPVITTNSTVSPDGNTTADTIEDDNGSGFESLLQNITIANDSTSWTSSIYVLKDSNTSRFPEIQMIFTGGTTVAAAVQLNTSTGAVNHRLGAGSASAEDAGDFWRLVITEPNNSTGNTVLEARIFPAVTTTFGLIQQAATGSIIVWGAQVENADFLTSYIPTTTVAVTRAAETVSIPLSGFGFDNTQYSAHMKGTMDYADNGLTIEVQFWRIQTGTTEHTRMEVRTSGSRTGQPVYIFRDNVGGSKIMNGAVGQYSPGLAVPFNVATAWDASNVAMSPEGLTVVTNSSPSPLPDFSGQSIALFLSGNGHCLFHVVYASKLSNTDLEGLSL